MEIPVNTASTSKGMNLVSESVRVAKTTFVDLNVKKTLSFTGMKKNVSEAMMTSYFKQFGSIVKVKRNFNPETNKSTGNGYIVFKNAKNAYHVLRSSPHVISSSKIRVIRVKFRSSNTASTNKGRNLVSESVRVAKTTSTGLNVTKTLSFRRMKQDVSRAMMTSYFKQFGPIVKVKRHLNPVTGKSSGNGYIQFKNSKDAEHALRSSLHVIGSSKIRVDIFRSSNTASTSKSMNLVSDSIQVDNAFSMDLNATETCRLRFMGMKQNVSKAMMTSYFQSFGPNVEVIRYLDPQTYKSSGTGYIAFANADDAKYALKSSPHVIGSSNVRLDIFSPKQKFITTSSSRNSLNLVSDSIQVDNAFSMDLNATETCRSLFMGMKQNVSKAMMNSYFQSFGPNVEAIRYLDPQTGKRSGTGYIADANADDAKYTLRSSPHVIGSSNVRLDVFSPRPKVINTSLSRNSSNLVSDSMRVENTNSVVRNIAETYRLGFTEKKRNASKAMMTSPIQRFDRNVEVMRYSEPVTGKSSRNEYFGFANANDADFALRSSPHVISSSNTLVDFLNLPKLIVLCILPYFGIWCWNQGFVSYVRSLPTFLISFF